MDENFYRTIIQNSDFGFAYHQIITDSNDTPIDYIFIEVNDAFEKITGLNKNAIIRETVRDVLPGIENSGFDWIGTYGEVAMQGGSKSIQQYSPSLGKWFQVQVSSTEKGYFSTIFVDITDQKLESDELESFFSVALDLLCIADNEGNFVKLNKEWERVTGYTIEELMTFKYFDLIHPEDLEATFNAAKTLSEGNEVIHFINRYRCKDGTYKYIEWNSHPKGSLVYAAARDITHFIKNEEQLKIQAGFLDSIVESLPYPFYVVDVENYEIIKANSKAKELVAGNFFKGMKCHELTHKSELPCECDEHICPLKEVKTTKDSVVLEHIHYDMKGNKRNVEVNAHPILNDKGEVCQVIEYSIDVTEKKKIEADLERERQRLDYIIKGTNVGTWEWNIQTGETIFNEEWANIVGYKLDEISPVSINTWMSFAHPDDLAESNRRLEMHFNAEADFYECESRMKHKDGSWIWVLDRGRVYKWSDDGKPLLMYGTHQDITERKQIEHALKASEEQYRLIAENSTDVIWTMNLQGQFTYISPSVERLRGFTPEEVKKQSPEEVLTPASLEYYVNGIHNVAISLEKNSPFPELTIELEQPCKDGTTVWTEATVSGLFKSDGELIGILGVTRDISERKNRQLEFDTMINTTKDGFFVSNLLGEVISFNKAFCEMLGYTAEEMSKMKISDFEAKEKPEETKEHIKKVFEEGFDVFETQHRKKDGSIIDTEISVTFLHQGDGRLIVFARDISERKKVQAELDKTLERYGVLADQSRTVNWEVDTQGLYTYISPNVFEIWGYMPEEIVGKLHFYDLHPEESREIYKEAGFDLINSRERIFNYENPIVTKEGSMLWMLSSGMPIIDENDVLLGFRGSDSDITQRKEIENKIRYQSNFQKLVANISYEFINADLENFTSKFNIMLEKIGRFLDVDRSFLFELSEDENYMSNTFEWCAEGVMPVKDLVQNYPVDNVPIIAQIIRTRQIFFIPDVDDMPEGQDKEELKIQEVKSVLCLPIIKNNLFIGYFGFDSVKSKRNFDEESIELMKILANIIGDALVKNKIEIEKKTAEEALRRSEAKMRAVFDNSNIGISITDPYGGFVMTNKYWNEYLRFTEEEMKKLSYIEITHSDDLDISKQYFEQIVNKEISTYRIEKKFLRSDGKTVWGDLSVAAIFDSSGNIENLVGMVVDVTEQKLAQEQLKNYSTELEMINEELRVSKEQVEENLFEKNILISQLKEAKQMLEQSLNEKDKFFSIIAHDLRNPLGNFKNLTSLFSESYKDLSEDDLFEYIELMKESSDNVYSLLENLLEWSRSQRGTMPFNPIELDAFLLAQSTIDLLSSIASSKAIKIENSIASPSKVNADPNMLTTILRNLVSNAIKFTPEGGTIEIGAINKPSECSKPSEGSIQIYIKDSGVGMTPETIDKLFRIDQNVTNLGTSGEKGTGLGLILCKEFVDRHGGRIWVESEEGKGSTFYFTLPTKQTNDLEDSIG